MNNLIGSGIYNIPEAARLAHVNEQTARRWIVGDGHHQDARLLQPDVPPVNSRFALSFLNLIDLLVVGRFRKQGVSLQTTHRVYTRLADLLHTPHPFSHQILLTDGKTIFMELLDHFGDKHLEEVLSGQKAMPEVLGPYLKKIDYAVDTKIAARWNIAPGVVLDPDRAFGKPIINEEGITTFVLAQSYWANGEDADLVADLFNITPDTVRKAVDFEREFFPRRAA